MKTNFRKNLLPALLITVMALPAFAQPAVGMPEVMQQGDITYISGGIGDGESEAIEATKKDYNLHVLSAETTGAYIGNTHVVITDKTGAELLSSDVGPLFYAQLPAGTYIVTGTRHEETKKQTVHITKGKPVNIRFAWKPTASEEN